MESTHADNSFRSCSCKSAPLLLFVVFFVERWALKSPPRNGTNASKLHPCGAVVRAVSELSLFQDQREARGQTPAVYSFSLEEYVWPQPGKILF